MKKKDIVQTISLNLLGGVATECTLRQYIDAQNWKLIFYGSQKHAIGNRLLSKELFNLEEYAATKEAFAYQDKNYKIIFIHDNHKTSLDFLLAHEIAHIASKHMSNDGVIAKDDPAAEREANKIAKILLKMNPTNSSSNKIHICNWCICSLLIILFTLSIFGYFGNEIDTAKDSLLLVEPPIATTHITRNPQPIQPTPSERPIKEPLPSEEDASIAYSSNSKRPRISSSPAEMQVHATVPEESPSPLDSSNNLPQKTPEATSPAANPAEHPDSPAFAPEQTQLVYLAKSPSEVYHLSADCSYIKGHDGVRSVPFSQVPQRRLCSRCAAKR